MRIFVQFLFIIFLFFRFPNLYVQPYEGEKGDVNNDGNINVLDMLRLANHILDITILNEMEFWRADLNGPVGNCDGDETTNVLDMIKIAHIILGNDECPSTTVTDIDGNVYRTVTIGTQVWMAENLKVTRYCNGDTIPNVSSNSEWTSLTTGACCVYDNDADHMPVYGRLYNWYAVNDSRGIAPEGWHVPSDDEWKQLEMYLGMSLSEVNNTGLRGTEEGGKMKETGIAHWNNPNSGATNESGFSALPGGCRGDTAGDFNIIGYGARFWSSSSVGSYYAWDRGLGYDYSQIYRDAYDKRLGYSLRCIKD